MGRAEAPAYSLKSAIGFETIGGAFCAVAVKARASRAAGIERKVRFMTKRFYSIRVHRASAFNVGGAFAPRLPVLDIPVGANVEALVPSARRLGSGAWHKRLYKATS